LHVVDAGGVGPQRHERHRVIQQVPVRTQRGMQRGGTRRRQKRPGARDRGEVG
jgi:hypothetical protein